MHRSFLDIDEIAKAPRSSVLGAETPARFAGVEAECGAVRAGTGVYVASFRAWLRMRGEDRVEFLHGMVSNDVKSLAAGRGLHAAVLTQQGKIVSDLRIYAEPQSFLLDFPATGILAARQSLEKYIIADDAEIAGAGVELIGLDGARAPQLLAAVNAGVPSGRFGLADAAIAGSAVQIAGAALTGEHSFLIGCRPDDVARVWEALRHAGAIPVGADALDVLRIEAGVPLFGVDMDDGTLVMEAELPDAVSFTKGCYLGQEVVERVAARGHVNRKRVALRIDGDAPPRGTLLFAAAREVGRVTGSVRSPLTGDTIGMGYVHRDFFAPGTELEAGLNAQRIRVVVESLPRR